MEQIRASVLSAVDACLDSIPKFELHAHVNGSIPLPLLRRFAQEDLDAEEAAAATAATTTGGTARGVVDKLNVFMQPLPPSATPEERMRTCFLCFDVVFSIMTKRERLFEATRAIVRFFYDEGCVYVELRTTPKPLPDGTTDEQYVDCVLQAIDAELAAIAAEQEQQTQQAADAAEAGAGAAANTNSCCDGKKRSTTMMRCNLLLSINRRVAPEVASRVVDLAVHHRAQQQAQQQEDDQAAELDRRHHAPRVVGIDLCGDCFARTFAEFAPLLRCAKSRGLPITIHCGEKPDDGEVRDMLACHPDRVGHCVFINDEAHRVLRTRQVPLEICITSNMLTSGLARPREHHVADQWMLDQRHPFTINTDDFSVFSTTLKRELQLFAEICVDLHLEKNQRDNENNNNNENNESATSSSSFSSSSVLEASALRFVLEELWRVEFNAARCCFADSEARDELLETLSNSHEEFCKQHGW